MNSSGPYTVEKNTVFVHNEQKQRVFARNLEGNVIMTEIQKEDAVEEGEPIDRNLTSLVSLGTEKGRFMIAGTEKGEVCVFDEKFGACADIVQAHGNFFLV